MQDNPDDLLVSRQDELILVTINRPQARNAFTFAMYERLASLCATINDDPSVRALIITGAGEQAFSSGTDISQFAVFDKAEDGWAYEDRFERVLHTLETCRVPTIAAISGVCTGGGAAIAACCDLRIATTTLRFGFPIARTLGNCLSLANYARLSTLLGPARVKDLIFRARLLGADEAFAAGLISEIVLTADALLPKAHDLAATIMRHAPLTMQTCKTALLRLRDEGPQSDDRDLIAACYMSDDFREGMTAFLEKRTPNWTGR